MTAACRKWVQQGRAARQDWLFRNIAARLTAKEQDQLTAAVALLARLIDD